MISTIERITGYRVERLQSGAFTTAYRAIEDRSIVFLLVPTEDYAKTILINSSNPHIPTMKQVCIIGDNTLYQTEYSAPVSKEHRAAYTQMTNLAIKWSNIRNKHNNSNPDTWSIIAQSFVESLRVNSVYTSDLIDAIRQLYSRSIEHTTRFKFDMPVENFGVSDDGTLILRDIVLFR